MIYPVVAYGDPVLRKVGKDIDKDYPELQELIGNMFETMYKNNGLGLAAVQVGVHKRIITIDIPKEYGDNIDDKVEGYESYGQLCIINPEIVFSSQEEHIMREGCLSIPNQSAEIKRSKCIEIKYIDYNGAEKTTKAQGWLARCIEHEIDHLNGVLFFDHLSKLKREIATKTAIKHKKHYTQLK